MTSTFNSILSIIVILCIIDNGYSRLDNKSSWTGWSWSCEKGNCVKKLKSSENNLTGNSVETCRLVCGQYGSLWPKPTIFTKLSNKVIPFHPSSLSFTTDESLSVSVLEYMNKVYDVFYKNVQNECKQDCTILSNTVVNIRVDIISNNLTLSWETDESYTLNIKSQENEVNVQIHAPTAYGARHGLETLSQLITSYKVSSNVYSSATKYGLIIVSEAKIEDKPVYPHRGLMLDTARHYIPINLIKRTIDGLSSTKMNILHWHATDTQSFPLEFTRLPQMSKYGAYSQEQIYTPEDVRDLLHYAKVRGVRIILEIDAPAHAGAGWQWGRSAGLDDLVACWQHHPWREQCIQPPCGQLNPANPHLYRVLGDLYKDVVELFPPMEIFHMGGDEVFFPCWNATKQIIDLLESRGMGREESDFIKLWAEYQETALRIYDDIVNDKHSPKISTKEESKNSKLTPIILWSSHLTNPLFIEKYLPKERYIVQTWVPEDNPLSDQLLELGYRIIYSTKDAWYLDHGFWGITQYYSWRKVYENKIPTKKSVLGGETCMWTEYVDESNLEARVWPRTAAAAERLWSNPSTSALSAEARFASHRERLVTKGLQPETIQPFWCYQNGGKCA